MSAMTGTIYNQQTGEVRTLPMVQAEHMATNTRGEWSFKPPLAPGWDREVPRYRIEHDLHPPTFPRHRLETPFLSSTDTYMHQYSERPLRAGEELELTVWPHASMTPLNETARAVMSFFNSHQKSRLPLAPWYKGKLRLDDGLSGAPPQQGTLRPNLPSMSSAAVPHPVRVAG